MWSYGNSMMKRSGGCGEGVWGGEEGVNKNKKIKKRGGVKVGL